MRIFLQRAAEIVCRFSKAAALHQDHTHEVERTDMPRLGAQNTLEVALGVFKFAELQRSEGALKIAIIGDGSWQRQLIKRWRAVENACELAIYGKPGIAPAARQPIPPDKSNDICLQITY